ncbi:PilZ domain-containing protein [Novosphingobium sp. RD2P27]|uniref:PilZ domain-containing protein n=1 Tax=Novosphingobium kalidii TaxID=3230299 RepID=A0ABV2D529_9SPHN
MEDFGDSKESRNEAIGTGAEMRGAPRFTLMLRSAKLIADSTEYLCIIRDVSETGIKLRLFHQLPDAGTLMIETPGGQRYPMQLVWAVSNEAGFRFDYRIDVDTFVSQGSPYPKRPLRLRVHHPACVKIGAESLPATILDISRQGARIESETRLAIGQRFCLEARELPLFEATVCWRRVPEYGLAFAQVMGLDELAQRAARMNRSPLPASAKASEYQAGRNVIAAPFMQ